MRLQKTWESAVAAFPLLGWISYEPVLLTFGAMLLVIAGVGTRLGIPSLIWHDSLVTQLFAGLAAAGLALHLGLVAYLLDDQEQDAELAQSPDYDCDDDSHDATVGRIARYVFWPCAVLLADTVIGWWGQKEVRWSGILVLVGPAVALATVVYFRNSPRRLSTAPARTIIGSALQVVRKGRRKARWARRGIRVDQGAHALQVATMGFLALAYAAAYLLKPLVPAAVALALALALVTGLWGMFAFWLQRYRLLGIGGLVVVAFMLGVTRDVPPRGLTDVQLMCDRSAAAPSPRLIPNQLALDAWKSRLVSAGEQKPPLVVVVTSGGASRAAVWTITMLAELESRLPGFMRHVRLITGASGGMVGAAHYVSAMDQGRRAGGRAQPAQHRPDPCRRRRRFADRGDPGLDPSWWRAGRRAGGRLGTQFGGPSGGGVRQSGGR